jgi:NAD-dependent deacetylase
MVYAKAIHSASLYGESLPEKEYINGINAIKKADMLLVLGSSLTVYPASNMIDYFKGKYLVIINNDKTPYDYKANLVINDNLSKISSILINKI